MDTANVGIEKQPLRAETKTGKCSISFKTQ